MSCSSGCCCGSSSSGCPCDSLFEAVPSLAGIPASLYGDIASASGGSLSKLILNATVVILAFNTFFSAYTVYSKPSDTQIKIGAVIIALVISIVALIAIYYARRFWDRVRKFLGDPSTIDYYIKIAEDLKSRIDDCCSCCGCCSQLVRGWVDKVLEDTKSQLEDIKRRGLLEMIKKTR